MTKNEAIGGKLQTLIFVFIAVILVISFFKNIEKVSKSEGKLDVAEKKVNNIKEENKKLRENLENVNNSYFQEQQLRDKLGMSKEGEIILIMPDDDTLRNFAPKVIETETVTLLPNWKKWLNLFLEPFLAS